MNKNVYTYEWKSKVTACDDELGNVEISSTTYWNNILFNFMGTSRVMTSEMYHEAPNFCYKRGVFVELWLEQSMFSFTKYFLSNVFRLVQFKTLHAF